MSLGRDPIPHPADPRTDPGGTSHPLLWTADASGAWVWASQEWEALTGLGSGLSLGRGWLAALHPDDRPRALDAWDAARLNGRYGFDSRLRQGSHGIALRARFIASPRRSADGDLLGWCGVAVTSVGTDVTLASAAAEELRRHTRETLAVIRSVARRTARTSDSIEHHATHFEGRLDALARVQSAAIRVPDGGVDLEALAAEEMLAHRVDDERVTIEGPRVRLRSAAADILGLALHELAINAVKFGAFGSGNGTVALRWTIDAAATPARLDIEWRERGIAVAAPAPRRKGFGSELIEKSLPYDLNAVTSLDFLPGGLRCLIAVPLSPRIVLDLP